MNVDILKIVSILVVLLARMAHAGDSSTPVQSNQAAAFASQMQSWVDGNFRSIGEDKTRYLLRRIGCDIKSGTDSEKPAGKKNQATLQDDIRICRKKKGDFYCKAAITLIEDKFVEKNDVYYDYCRANRK